MTKSEKLQAVTEAIQKACPDLLELKRGSRVLFQNKEEIILFYESEPKGGLPATFMLLNINDNRIHSEYVSWIDEILGQPIGPLEILRVLPPSWMLKYDVDHFEFVNKVGQWDFRNEYFYWKPNKPLDQQEEPVISLLYSIFYP